MFRFYLGAYFFGGYFSIHKPPHAIDGAASFSTSSQQSDKLITTHPQMTKNTVPASCTTNWKSLTCINTSTDTEPGRPILPHNPCLLLSSPSYSVCLVNLIVSFWTTICVDCRLYIRFYLIYCTRNVVGQGHRACARPDTGALYMHIVYSTVAFV